MSVYKQTGRAHVYGIDGDLTFTGIATEADQQFITADVTNEANVEELDNGDNETIGFDITKVRDRISIDFYPTVASGSTQSHANAAKALKPPSIPSKVTLSNMKEGATSEINGDWIYAGGATRKFIQGKCVFTLPLWRPVSGSMTVDQLLAAVV